MRKITNVIMFLTLVLVSAVAVSAVETKLCNSAVPGKSTLVAFEGVQYEVDLIDISGTKAKFTVNGEVTNLLEEDEKFSLADVSNFIVTEVGSNKVEFCINIVPVLDDLSLFHNPLKKGESTTETYLNVDYEIKVLDVSKTNAKFRINGAVVTLRHPKLGGTITYIIDNQAMFIMSQIVEYDGNLYANFGVGEIPEPLRPAQQPPEEEIREMEMLKARETRYMNPLATPAGCGVPAKFQDRTDVGLITVPGGGIDGRAHGKRAGKLKLEGLYWVFLKSVSGETATIEVNKESATINEGQSRQINGVVVYAYEVGDDFIDYCIHETQEQYVRLTCTVGCVSGTNCLPFGARFVDADGETAYCGFDKQVEAQKDNDAGCQNNYECKSNLCSDAKCVALAEKLGLLDRIAAFLKKLFGFGG